MQSPEFTPAGATSQKAHNEDSCGQQCNTDTGCGSAGGGGGADLPPAIATVARAAAPAPGTLCMKCRKQEAQVVARGREPLCYPCLHDQLLSKVRNAVRMHSLILPGDRLAVAYSGGLGSAALLRLLSELRNPRTDRPARGKVSFSMHIIHIDESAALGLSDNQQATAGASLAAAVQRYCDGADAGVQYHVVRLESAFAEAGAAPAGAGAEAPTEGAEQAVGAAAGACPPEHQQLQAARQRQQLQALLAAVKDATGREDLTRHLRTQLLLRTAARLGCGRVARGDSATALAAHIVAASAKGCGYSLPGDVSLVDARHGAHLPSTFCPLREVSSRELALACTHWRLSLPQTPAALLAAEGGAMAAHKQKQNINALATAFIAGMETHNPGSVSNILNTISKLYAFPWNDPAQASPANHTNPHQLQQAQQHQQQQRAAAEALPASSAQQQQEPSEGPSTQQRVSAVLCPICWAPLADDELAGSSGSAKGGSSGGHTSSGAAAATAAGCCMSCSGQILGNNVEAAGSAPSDVAAALPPAVRQQMAALAAAGPRAAACAATGAADTSVDHLRAQIAEFLLE